MTNKQFHLLQLVQAGIGFDEADHDRLTAVSLLIQPDILTAHIPATAELLRPLLNRWARHNLLAPRDNIYAQRLWLLALGGLSASIPLTLLSDAIYSFYQQIGAQLTPEQLTEYQDMLQKGAQVDIAMLEQCYHRAPQPNLT